MNFKRREGFTGQKMIRVPDRDLTKAIKINPLLAQLYITQMGYFPKASFHYHEQKKGCIDNILIYCLHGKGWYVVGRNRYQVKANEYILLPAGREYTRYGADSTDPWTTYWIRFNGSDINLFNHSFHLQSYSGPHPVPFNERSIQLWETMYRGLETGTIESICNANFCLYQFIALFLFADQYTKGHEEFGGDVVGPTVQYMEDRIDRRITVEELAALQGLSVSYFSALFRKATGMGPLDYFIHLKIRRACELLQSGRRKIKEVAQRVGYDDPYYFSRLFKKYTAVSPAGYRKINSGPELSDPEAAITGIASGFAEAAHENEAALYAATDQDL